jgi:hypothetical protein
MKKHPSIFSTFKSTLVQVVSKIMKKSQPTLYKSNNMTNGSRKDAYKCNTLKMTLRSTSHISMVWPSSLLTSQGNQKGFVDSPKFLESLIIMFNLRNIRMYSIALAGCCLCYLPATTFTFKLRVKEE